MSDAADPSDLTILAGGVLGKSPRLEPIPVLVAPSVGAEFNTITAGLVPVACFRVDDIRFAFDSSFIGPGIQAELARLGGLLNAHPPASLAAKATPPLLPSPLAIFGHADPTGDDEYNKILSGRRAQAVYALMIRDVDSWNELYTKPHGEDRWGVPAIDTMLAFLNREGESAEAIDGNAVQRKALFAQYMSKLCGEGLPRLGKGDFLGQGKDAKGKGDFQGCGEFNPVLVLSQKKQTDFQKRQDETERNEANAPNRRVMILIFREGSRVDSSRWPCPRASEASAGCRKRFWSDGEERRSARLPDDDRKFETGKDTFACRFYQRLSDRSPCERVLKTFLFRVRLYSGFGKALPNAPFSVSIQGRDPTPLDQADGKGIIELTLRDVVASSECTINWGFPLGDGQPPELLFSRKIFLVPEDDSSEEAALKKLNNLGYESDDSSQNILGFQLDYGHLADPPLDPIAKIDQRTAELIRRVYEKAADDLRNT